MTPPHAPPLARICLDHLDLEEAGLVKLRDSLSQLHRALVSGDTTALAAIAAQQVDFTEFQRRTENARESFRRSAIALGAPMDRLTVSLVADRLPEPWAGQVHESRQRVSSLATEVRAAAQRTFTILASCRAFTRRVLAEICGAENETDRYGPGGTPLDAGRPRHVVSGRL